ncbi:MAG: hypothetical protein ACKVZJ_14790 [Phycisphaerales bacterium]
MDPKALKSLVERSIVPMKTRLNLGPVEVTYFTNSRLARDDDGMTRGTANPNPLYGRVTIELDPTHLDDDDEALHVLRHELLHCYNQPLSMHHRLCLSVAAEAAHPALEESLTQNSELEVLALERMLDALGMTPKALAAPLKTNPDRQRGAKRKRPG